jgi:hypothetical protein
VAMGRALVREPQAFLMDEPLSNLDAKLRVEMRAEIARLQRSLDVTTLYVTHDQVEAMTMGTRVAVLDKGRLQQVDTPQRIYDAPRNLFVATFMGSPAMNLLPGRVVRSDDGDGLVIDLGAQQLPVDPALAAAHPGLAERVGQRVILGVRPEALDDAGLEPHLPGDRVLEATVDLVESLGAELVVHVAITGVTGVTDRSAAGDIDHIGMDAGNVDPAAAADAIQAVGNVRQAAILVGEVGEVGEVGAGRDDGDAGVTTVGAGEVGIGDDALVDGGEVEAIGDVSESAVAASEPEGEHWPAVVGRGGRAVARLSTRSRVRPGDTVKLAVDPTGVHLFDSTSGASLRTTSTMIVSSRPRARSVGSAPTAGA